MFIEKNLKIIKPLDLIYLIILAIFPLFLIVGNFFINFFILTFAISFFLNIKDNKNFFEEKIFNLFIFFFISLIINLFFSQNFENSLPRVMKIFFVIIFIFEIKRLILLYEHTFIKNIYKTWFLIFLIISIDVLFEVIFGYNLIGNKSYMDGRIVSFFGDELVVGAFYHGFVLFFLSYLINQKSKTYILIISIFCILIIGLFIGERSNFIKLFLSVLIFAYIALKMSNKKKIIITLGTIFILIMILSLNKSYKTRYFDQLITLFSINGYSNYMKASQYGAHRDVSMKIFKENLLFGIGIKNFRIESDKKKYENKKIKYTSMRQSTHPHQIHHEFLSETGVFGYISFLLFIFFSLYISIKNYLYCKNLYQLSAIIFIITSVLPLLPSGSFFSTYASGIFWLNFAIMNSYIKQLNFRKIK